MARKLTRTLRRWLYIGHRWIGIVTCLFFAMWFVSGVVMMYVAFPGLSEKERLAALPDLAWQKAQLSPDQAMLSAGATQYPRDLRLHMMDDEPVYLLTGWDGKRRTISAVDGRTIDGVSLDRALAVARHYPQAADVQLIEMVDRDQWSVTARFDPSRPMYQIALNDEAGTRLYVSSRTGEIVLDTSTTERVWNWLGSIPHWIYPTVLRKDNAVWRQVILWLSGACLVVTVSGIWIGILRVRMRKRCNGGRITPYRGWMAWHHVTGLFAGVLVLSWMFSGWLSVNPGDFFSSSGPSGEMLQRYAGHDAPHIAAEVVATPSFSAVEARFVWVGGAPLMLLANREGLQTATDPATGLASPLPEAGIFAAALRLLPETAMPLQTRLDRYDLYWYAHHNTRLLPVLRVGFDDEARSWFHLDPTTGDVLGRSDTSRRTYRWLFNALHSLDFPLLLTCRPAWDVAVWLLSLLGMTISVSGIVIGWRHLGK